MSLSPTRNRVPFGKLVAVMCVVAFAGGCRSNPPLTTAEIRAEVEKFRFWKPKLLLTSDARYRKLEIEIDHVEGTGPTATELQSLTSFFQQQCRKPDGVKVRMDKAIPRTDARDKSFKALAEQHLDGPESADAAFIYFLFYDSRLAGTSPTQPWTMRLPFPGAVFVDRRWLTKWSRFPGTGDAPRRMLLHEAGHVLGLCENQTHGDWSHCTNQACLMNWSLQIRPLRLFWPGPVIHQRDFCSDCQADLAAYRDQLPADNLRFLGPYCVRSEADYHVLSSPGFIYVHLGRLEDLDLEALQRRRRFLFEENPKHEGVFYRIELPDEATERKLVPLLERDPLEQVREIAKQIRKKLSDGAATKEKTAP